jgi:hypothetical protein
MTRETKAGLVVSCSFLCLVGVVLVTKLREREATKEDPDVTVLNETPGDPTPASSEPAEPAPQTGKAGPATNTQERPTKPAGSQFAVHLPDVPSGSSSLSKDPVSSSPPVGKSPAAAENGPGAVPLPLGHERTDKGGLFVNVPAPAMNGPDLSPGGKANPDDKAPGTKEVKAKGVAELNAKPAAPTTDADRDFEKLLERLKKQTSEELSGSAAKGQPSAAASSTTGPTSVPSSPSPAGNPGEIAGGAPARSPFADPLPSPGKTQDARNERALPNFDLSASREDNPRKPLPPPPLGSLTGTQTPNGADSSKQVSGIKSAESGVVSFPSAGASGLTTPAAGPIAAPSTGANAASAAATKGPITPTAPSSGSATPLFDFGSTWPSPSSGSTSRATGGANQGTAGPDSSNPSLASRPPVSGQSVPAPGSGTTPSFPTAANSGATAPAFGQNAPSGSNQAANPAGPDSKIFPASSGSSSLASDRTGPAMIPVPTRTEPIWPSPPSSAPANPASNVQLTMPSAQPTPPMTPARPTGDRSLVAQGPSPASDLRPSIASTGPRPPLETPAAAATTGAAVVESYDEETYTARPSDNFRTISRAYFQDERYAQALWQFNRDHPLATDQIRQGMDSLPSGTNVYIPPLRILQKYYSQAIGESAPGQPQGSAAAGLSTSPVVAVSQPRQSSYQVSGTGEMFRDIARKTLNDPERWVEIYQLNRTYDPSVPVPAGAELRLPGDARVQ